MTTTANESQRICSECGASPALHDVHHELTPWHVRYYCDACVAALDIPTAPEPEPMRDPRQWKTDCALCGNEIDKRDTWRTTRYGDGQRAHRTCLMRANPVQIAPPDGHENQRAYERYLDYLEFDRQSIDRG